MNDPLSNIAADPFLGLVSKKNITIEMLAEKINDLLNHDFQKLVSILYRMDISESKLRILLRENPDKDAGLIIAHLMIEREAMKIKSRNESKQSRKTEDDSDEKW